MEGYQMEFYGENRIVTLRYSILKAPDPRLKGQPALYYLYEDEFLTNAHAGTIYTYFKKNSYNRILVNSDDEVLLTGDKSAALYYKTEKISDYVVRK